MQGFSIRSRIQANNGDVLLEAAALGLGITCHPTFITAQAVAAGRVRVLTEFIAERLA